MAPFEPTMPPKTSTKPSAPKATAKASATTEAKEQTSNVPEVCLDPTDWDRDNLLLNPPKTNEFTMGGMKVKTTMTQAQYLDADKRPCSMFFPGPTQRSFGTSYQHEIAIKEAERDESNAKGVQICYSLTSMQTIDSPTEEEQAFKDLIDGLYECAIEHAKEEASRKPPLIPPVSKAAIKAIDDDDYTKAVKPPYSRPKDQNTGKPRSDRPYQIYVKLVTQGGKDGKPLRVLTPFYGPKDKKQNPLKYLNVPCMITPLFRFDGIYWGQHGNDSPYGASLRFILVSANVVPVSASSALPSMRMLPKNTAVVEDDDDSDDEMGMKPARKAPIEDDNSDFEDETPISKIKKAAAAKGSGLEGSKTPAKEDKKPAAKASVKAAATKPAPKKGKKPPTPPESDESSDEVDSDDD